MTLTIKLLESNSDIEKKIKTAIAEELNALIKKNFKTAQKRIESSVSGWVTSQPEVQSLLREGVPNSLHAQFGLQAGQGLLSSIEIVNAIIASIEVRVKQVDAKLNTGIDFNIQPENLRNLLGLPSGFTQTEDQDILPWLTWLLLEGSNTIVYGYTYVPDLSGRSGGGTMEAGGSWRIPPEFSGTIDDNFVTRALSNRDKELEGILRGIFT
jgi:hypothetical protein